MAWNTAVNDVRIQLNDGAQDKLCFQKAVFGAKNGVNTVFKTFEFRRITDFTSASSIGTSLGIYLNSVRLPASGVVSDDVNTGAFFLLNPPQSGDELEASYYGQWFLDSEIQEFLTQSMTWMGQNTDYSMLTDGLIPAAIQYCAYLAYQKLALKYAISVSETYRLEDSPDDKRMSIIDAYRRSADAALKQAVSLRDDYYTRKGQAKAPLFGMNLGYANDVTPRS